MTNYQEDQLENIRRVCESTLKSIEPHEEQRTVDSFQHILNLVELIKSNY